MVQKKEKKRREWAVQGADKGKEKTRVPGTGCRKRERKDALRLSTGGSSRGGRELQPRLPEFEGSAGEDWTKWRIHGPRATRRRAGSGGRMSPRRRGLQTARLRRPACQALSGEAPQTRRAMRAMRAMRAVRAIYAGCAGGLAGGSCLGGGVGAAAPLCVVSVVSVVSVASVVSAVSVVCVRLPPVRAWQAGRRRRAVCWRRPVQGEARAGRLGHTTLVRPRSR
jgi:hypothetical protein